MSLAQQVHTHAEALKVLRDPRVTHTEASKTLWNAFSIATSSTAVRRWRSNNDWERAEETTPAAPAAEGSSVRAEEDTQGLTVYHDSWPVQLGEDLSPLIEFFGYDPKHFLVVDDSVKMSKWQSSKGTEDGGRDIIWLYSYKARFQRIQEPINEVDDLDEAVARIRRFAPKRRNIPVLSEDVVYVHQQGDEQIGKREGGGIDGVTQRTEDAIQQSYDRLRGLLKRNPNISGILDVANGDTVENIFGHYPSQQRTTATLRKQFKAGRDLDLMRTQALAEFGLPITKVYCTDNHGEMRQTIGLAPYTSESDNLTLILAESVKDVIDRSVLADQITWKIPHDEWWTLVTVAGLNIAVGHGHKATGKLEEWVRKQRDYLHMHHDFRANLALLGHKHHFLAQDISGTTMIQTPSLDGGSPFFAAMQGNVSQSGIVTYLAGKQFNQFFTDLVVL
jgi:hypothetical protein